MIEKATLQLSSLFLSKKWQLITACESIGVPEMLTGKKVYLLYASLRKIRQRSSQLV
jgi:hypothetical protein